MKFMNIKLMALTAVSAASIGLANSVFASPEAFGSNPSKTKVLIGDVDPEMQKLVDQFQSWALAKIKNPSAVGNDMIILPYVDTEKRILGTDQRLTEEKMSEALVKATTSVGYTTPMEAILSFKFAFLTSGADFLNMSDDYITKKLAHNNSVKAKSLIDARDILRQNYNKTLPIEAKVIGPATLVNIYDDLKKLKHCQTVSCDQKRLKIPVRIFGTSIQKILDSGVLDENDLKGLLEIATTNYYFVKNQSGKWVLEEVPFGGVSLILSKTSL